MNEYWRTLNLGQKNSQKFLDLEIVREYELVAVGQWRNVEFLMT
jgi:hypothetical protein